MKNKIIFLFALAVIISSPATLMGEVTFPEMEGFTIDTDYDVYVPDTLYEYINGASEVFLQYEFEELHIADYYLGDESINVEIYVHGTPEMAFGMYTKERRPTYTFVDIGIQGHQSATQIYFVKGRNYVKVMTSSTSSQIRDAMAPLAMKLSDSLEGTLEMPSIVTQLPKEGRTINGEVFLTESVMGHPFLENAYKISYSRDGKKFDVFVFTSLNPEDNHKMIASYLEWAGVEGVSPDQEEIFLTDKYNGPVFIRQKAGKLVFVNGLDQDSSSVFSDISGALLEK